MKRENAGTILPNLEVGMDKYSSLVLYSVNDYEAIAPDKASYLDAYLSQTIGVVPFYSNQRERYSGISHKNLYQFPLILQEDLLQDPYQLISPNSRITQLTSSGGTYGKRKLLFRTNNDLEKSIDTASAMFLFTGITENDIVAIMQPFDLWNIGHIGMGALKKIGVLNIPLGLSAKEEDILDILDFTKATVLYGTPTKVTSLAILSEQKGMSNELNISRVLCAGEPISQDQRNLIKKIWGAEIFGIYGSEETDGIGAECTSHDGYHLLDNNLIIEVLGPNALLPAGKPEGVIAVTKVGYEGTTLIRYLLGDKVQVVTDTCECGDKSPKLKLRGRLEEMVWLYAGTKVAVHSIDDLMNGLLGKIPQYQILVRQQTSKDVLVVKINSEQNPELENAFYQEIRKISQDLSACLDSGKIEIKLELSPDISIFESTVRGKLPKIIYRREGIR